jgi:PBP1b-binding outer membrane lipoprotein LpoB
LLLLLLAACSDEEPPKQAVNEMIESPLQNTVISSFDTYPPRPVVATDSQAVLIARGEEERARGEAEERFWRLLPL